MHGPDPAPVSGSRAGRVWASVSTRLVILLIVSMTCVFGLLGYLNIRLHQQHLEQTTLASAVRLSDVIKRNATYSMLHNERDSLHQMISEMANQRGIVRVRIINSEGRISFSSDPQEVNQLADGNGIAPLGAVAGGSFSTSNIRERFRTFGFVACDNSDRFARHHVFDRGSFPVFQPGACKPHAPAPLPAGSGGERPQGAGVQRR